MFGFSLSYSLRPSEGMVMSGVKGAGAGLWDINSQVSFLMKCKGICIKESKFMQLMSKSV